MFHPGKRVHFFILLLFLWHEAIAKHWELCWNIPLNAWTECRSVQVKHSCSYSYSRVWLQCIKHILCMKNFLWSNLATSVEPCKKSQNSDLYSSLICMVAFRQWKKILSRSNMLLNMQICWFSVLVNELAWELWLKTARVHDINNRGNAVTLLAFLQRLRRPNV